MQIKYAKWISTSHELVSTNVLLTTLYICGIAIWQIPLKTEI